MAEYAGLEIRIGGNTTKLTNALKASTKSAAELQSRIRQATKAMQFDPHNLKNIETRIKVTGDRIQSMQSKVQIAREAMQQLGDTMTSVLDKDGKAMTVKRLSEEMGNLSLKAKQADERFNGLTGTLAKIYEGWNKVARANGAEKLADKLGFTDAEAEHLMSSTVSLREFIKALRDEQELRSSFGYDGGKSPITDAEIETMKKFKSLNFHDMFKNGLMLDDVVEDARNLGIVIEESAVESVRDLQRTFKDAQQEKKAFDDALRFEQMGNDIERMNSEAESMSQTVRKLDDGLHSLSNFPAFQNLETEIRSIDAALDNVEHDLARTGEAMKIDPGNIELAKRYMHDLQQKVDLSQQKAALLNQEMKMLDANGAKEAISQHQDLAKWIEETAEAARVASMELSDQQAKVANLDDQTKSLKQTIANMKGDSTLTQYSDNVIAWQTQTRKLTKEMEELAKAEQNVATEQKKLEEAKGAFDRAQAEADGYKATLEELKSEYEQLGAEYRQIYDDPSVDYDTKLGMYNRLGELEQSIQKVEVAYDGAVQNAKEFNSALQDQTERVSLAQAPFEQQKKKVDELAESVEALANTSEVRFFQNPTDEIEKLEASLEGLEGELEQAKAKENELEQAYNAKNNENELAKTAHAAQEVSQKADEARSSLKQASDEMKLKDNSILNPSTVKSIGMTLSATVTPLVTGLMYKMVDASSTIDSAYRDMRKTVEGTEEQFESLRKGAIDFSRTHVTSADQILEIEAIGGELGVATADLEAFATAISNIDVATNLDAEGAAEALGHLSNILHLTADDYDGFSDALVRLGNNGASTETEIANIATRIGSMGAIVGMSGSDVLAWASTIASTGQKAEAAGTAISRTMSFMETAVAAAGGTMDTSFDAINAAVEEGGDKLTVFASLAGMTAEEFSESWETNSEEMASNLNEQLEGAKGSLQKIADIAHMSASEFAKTWESDPTEALKAFIMGLNDIEAAEGSADKVLEDLGITAVRQKQAIEGLMQTVGGLDDNLRMSEDAWNGVTDKWGEAGDAANEAAKKAEGFSGQMQILKNIGQNALSELGEGAVPWIHMLSDGLQSASEWFSALTDNTKKWLVFAGGLMAALGPMLSIGASFANAKGEFQEWYDETTTGMNLIRLAYRHGSKDIDAALTGTMSNMQKMKLVGAELGTSILKGLAAGAIIAAIFAIGKGLYNLYKKYQDHISATKGLSDAIRGIGDAADVTVGQFELTASSLRALVDDSKDYESRLSGLTKTIEDSNKQYGTYAGQMDYYASTIATLGGKADLSKEEMYKLQAALQAVNDQCGTTYGLDEYNNVIDTTTGKIVEQTDVINANIEARKNQALIDYYSDDYAQAVGEMADAQEKFNEAQQKYNDLISESGRDDYFNHAKEVYGSQYDESKIQAAYESEVDNARRAMENYQRELDGTSDAVEKLDEKIATARGELEKSNKVIEDAAKAQEELDRRSATVTADVTGNMNRLYKATEELGIGDSGFNAIADGLAAVHANADELNGVDMNRLVSSFSEVDGSMAQVIAALEEGGVQMWTWNGALEQVPEAAEKMGTLTASAFQSMYEQAGEDLTATMTLIAGLDEVKVNNKTFYIGDNGSIIDEQGKIYDINRDLADIPDEVITEYYVDDAEAQQKALETKASLEEIAEQEPTPTVTLEDKTSKTASAVKARLDEIKNMKPAPTASLNDRASAPLEYIERQLRYLDGKSATVTVTTVEKTTKQATGGLNNRPVIPRHATGYIATGPTLTNQGWIGEDGIEAVANWATGGAVVPLTNKKYMLPIADAIADGMTDRMGGAAGVTNNYVINGLTVAPDSALAKAMDATFDEARRISRMGKR